MGGNCRRLDILTPRPECFCILIVFKAKDRQIQELMQRRDTSEQADQTMVEGTHFMLRYLFMTSNII